MQPANRLVCEIALQTGWRVDDILNLKSEDIQKALIKKRHSISIKEMKTDKKSTRYLPLELLERVNEQSGIIFAFEGRDDYRKHRTRQAVFIDLKNAAKRFKIKLNLSPHSLRKNYAVYLKQQGKSFEEIQKALNHSDIATTLLYALSDELNTKYRKKK